MTRAVQAFKARYNTYYNGHVAYLDGCLAQENGNKDNYTDIIPLYITGNKATVSIGKSDFDRAVEKCQKTIKQHTITKRPEWNSNKRKTEKDRIWLSQKEYNPFLYKAWFLMGKAQFQKGEYLEAASTFAYMEQLYFSHPDIIAEARLLQAKCYAEMEWLYDADGLISDTRRDSFPKKLEWLRSSVEADLQIRRGLYEEAIPNLQKAIKKEKRSKLKARMYFLLGQLYQQVGKPELAYKAYGKTIAKNPPYELEFNARIRQTEVLSTAQNRKKMIKRLNSMAKNPKNKDFLDQIYYAIGNIYLAQNDTMHAVWSYRDGAEKSTRNGVEKGVVLLRLGQLYWDMEEFVKAQECYSQVIGLLDKERDDYDDIDWRSKVLDELLPHAQSIELQDSLQLLARMDSAERMKVINGIIEYVKEQEKKKERSEQLDELKKQTASAGNQAATAGNKGQMGNNSKTPALWYFYNPTAVASGKTEFQKKWGKRELADNWRRKNKTVLDDFNSEDEAMADSLASDSTSVASTDSISGNAEGGEGEETENYEEDPHRPEYYLKDIPLTEEQMQASNDILVEALFNAGVIYKDRMENLPLADRTFQRILNDFPAYASIDEVYYNLFQLYSRLDRKDEAEQYRQKLIDEYPENKHVSVISDPDFEYKARFGKHVEDSLYTATYNAFQADDYRTVEANCSISAEEYPEGANRPRFMYLDAMAKLQLGDRAQFMDAMKKIVETYPESSVSELAGLYVKGLKEGRLLASGKMDMGSIWERRIGVGSEEDSLQVDTTFTAEKNCNFVFVIAYVRDSLDENQLLYEMARYNFTNFTVRNFDINIVQGDGINMLQVQTFQNFDEAYIYLHRLQNNEDMAYKLKGLKPFIIAEDNLKKLMRGRSFADYFRFYDDNLEIGTDVNMEESTLDQPTELPEPRNEEEYEDEENEGEENFIF